MLLERLDSSYEAYKRDTGILIQWLSETSKECGFISRSKEARLKGKQRRKAKESCESR